MPVITVEFKQNWNMRANFYEVSNIKIHLHKAVIVGVTLTEYGVRIMSIPPRLSEHPDTIPLEESDLISRQQQNILTSSNKVLNFN